MLSGLLGGFGYRASYGLGWGLECSGHRFVVVLRRLVLGLLRFLVGLLRFKAFLVQVVLSVAGSWNRLVVFGRHIVRLAGCVRTEDTQGLLRFGVELIFVILWDPLAMNFRLSEAISPCHWLRFGTARGLIWRIFWTAKRVGAKFTVVADSMSRLVGCGLRCCFF